MTLCAMQNAFGGTILDSGTTFTYLPPEVFERIRDSVTAYAEGRGLYRIEGPDPNVSRMLYCVSAVQGPCTVPCSSRLRHSQQQKQCR